MEDLWSHKFKDKLEGYEPQGPIPTYNIVMPRSKPSYWIFPLIAAAVLALLFILLYSKPTIHLQSNTQRLIAEAPAVLLIAPNYNLKAPVNNQRLSQIATSKDENKKEDERFSEQVKQDGDIEAVSILDTVNSQPTTPFVDGNETITPGNYRTKTKRSRVNFQLQIVPNPLATTLEKPIIAGGVGMDEPQNKVRDASVKMSFSAGLALGYAISDRLSLASGVSYNAHFIRYRQEDSFGSTFNMGSLNAHYLGIPFEISYLFPLLDNVSIYSTAGAKASWMISGADTHPLLLTGNASIGVQYNVSSTVGIYAAPQISYSYMPSGIVEYYKVHPLSIDLSFGLRINFPGH